MARATTFRDKPHARVYSEWARLPSWRAIKPGARLLLVEMMMAHRPGSNGMLRWSLTKVQKTVNCGRATAQDHLVALEKAGWITVEGRAGKRGESLFALTMFPLLDGGTPPSHAYRVARPPFSGGSRSNRYGVRRTKNRFSVNAAPVLIKRDAPAAGGVDETPGESENTADSFGFSTPEPPDATAADQACTIATISAELMARIESGR